MYAIRSYYDGFPSGSFSRQQKNVLDGRKPKQGCPITYSDTDHQPAGTAQAAIISLPWRENRACRSPRRFHAGCCTVITSYSIHYTKLYDSVSRCSAACRCGSPVPPNQTSVRGFLRSDISKASASMLLRSTRGCHLRNRDRDLYRSQ